MTDSQGAAKAAPAKIDVQQVKKEAYTIGARLKEPSTYGGLSIMLALVFHVANAQQLALNISNIGMAIGTIILALLAIFVPEKSSKPAAPGPNISSAVIILLTMAIGGLLIAGSAHAATRARSVPLPAPQLKLTGNLVTDAKNAIKGATEKGAAGALAQDLSKPFLDIANLITADNGDATKLATEIPALQDGNGQACWIAMQQFADVVKAHPVPLTFHLATDIESLRLLSMATNNVCKNPACTQVFTELANGVQQLAPVNASMTIPSLTTLCSKVPQIAVVAPQSAGAAPATSAAPSAATPETK